MNIETASTEQGGAVYALTRFPIKSVGADPVSQVFIDADGIVGDRRFAFFDQETGHLCSAKHPRRYSGLLACLARYESEPMPGVPLPPVLVEFPDGTVARQGDDLDARMSAHLGRSVALSAIVPEQVTAAIEWDASSGMARESVYADAVSDEFGDAIATYTARPRSTSTFADLSPLHLVTTSTLEHFARVSGGAFDWRRFRPSMVIATDQPGFVEEAWIGGLLAPAADSEEPGAQRSGLRIEVVMPSPRCVVPTLAHGDDVPAARTTLRAIVEHNTREVSGFGRGACLGVYADVASAGILAVGDMLGYIPGSADEISERTSRYASSRRSSGPSITKQEAP